MSPYHESWNAEAIARFEPLIAAHGGWPAWEALETLSFRIRAFRGGLLRQKGQGKSFHSPERVDVGVKSRVVTFTYAQHRDVYRDGAIEDGANGRSIPDGRALFRATTFERWDNAHVAYFFGYAFTCYMSYPFILPGCALLRWEAEPATFWLRFPSEIRTHSAEQRFVFGPDGHLARHDYRARLAGPLVYGAHETLDYVAHQGVHLARHRIAHPRLGPFMLPAVGIEGRLEFFTD